MWQRTRSATSRSAISSQGPIRSRCAAATSRWQLRTSSWETVNSYGTTDKELESIMAATTELWKRLGLGAVLAAGAALTIGMSVALAGDDGADAPNRASVLSTSLSLNWAG